MWHKQKYYTQNDEDVISREKEYIYKDKKIPADGDSITYGLALSGGGLRSSAFGLGVIHALVSRGVFKKIDYLSTVSGGGFVGSTLTWLYYNISNAGTHFN